MTAKGLQGSFNMILKTIKYFKIFYYDSKNNFRKQEKYKKNYSKVICEPFLEKRNLFPKSGNLEEKKGRLTINMKSPSKLILDFLQYADGKNNIKQISKYTKQKLNTVKKVYILLKHKKLVNNINN